MAFTHLHVHTEFSLLDGAAKIDKLVARAKELGFDSLAITDHGVMFGAVQFYEACQKEGIHPVIGCEVYTAARTRFDKDAVLDRRQGHLVLLCENEEGYRNLIRIVSDAYREGLYYKPRVDHELLRKYRGGLIALSACLAGKVQSEILNDNYEGAKKEALELLDIFGEGNFFLELQDQGLEEEIKVNEGVIRLSKETGIPLVATNDVHYIKREDAKAHDVLLCIQTKSNLSDPDRMRFTGDQFYLKSEQEMKDLFGYIPEALENTHKIAERCQFDFEFGNYHIPKFHTPEGYTETEYFEHLCTEGLKERYNPVTPELEERLRYEMDTIEHLGYVGYFLIVWDFINFAKTHGIMVGPGRGSAAGSIVAYSMKITNIDPIRFSLIFERFLNKERVSMPDIDVDFCIERRGEVIDYVKQVYGVDNVSQISTFGTLKARAVVKDVAKVMEVPFARSLEVSKMIPADLKITLDKALVESPDLKAAYDQDMQIHSVIDTAKALEGLARHSSTHAAGVVISKDPVDTYVPLVMTDKGLATQFTMTEIEHLGLLKMDFLGLRNLTAIRDCLGLIKKNTGKDIDLDNIDYTDQDVYRIIAAGNTTGIFQLESGGMTRFMQDLEPDCLEDLIAGISLYRPGPMDSIPTYVSCKKNPQNITYLVPQLEPILAPTYGCIVYQEQVMDIVRLLGGYSYGRADLVRRAMSKKKADVMAKEREFFVHGKLNEDGSIDVPGCIRNGVPEDAANEIFDQMTSFAAYAFNKSHAAAYAVVAYQTAWLKTHYPAEFMASLMTNPADNNSVATLIRNSADMGIETLPPDVTKSVGPFSTEDGKIRFGLMGVKHVGEGIVEEIIRAREKKMPTDFFEFIEGLDVKQINRGALEALIKAGAMDCFPGNRAQKLIVLPDLIESAQSEAKSNIEGQMSLFSMLGDSSPIKVDRKLPPAGDYPQSELLAMEKDMLGIYLTGHPLKEVEEKIKGLVSVTTEQMLNPQDNQLEHGKQVVVAGLITAAKTMITKKGLQMAFATLEDLTGSMELVIFPKTFDSCRQNIQVDKIVAVSGKLDLKEEGTPKVIADTIAPLELVSGRSPRCRLYVGSPEIQQAMIKLVIPAAFSEETGLMMFKKIAKTYRGDMPVAILVEATGNKYKLDYDLWIDPCEEFFERLYSCFGEDCIR